MRPPIVPSRHKPRLVASPRIERLRLDGDVERFWREVRDSGAPLIEAADEPGYAVLTFVWRGDERTRDVLLAANKLLDRTDPSASLMRNVTGTDVWHLSYRLRSDFRCSYRFCVDDGGTVKRDDEFWLAMWESGRSDPFGVEAKPGYSVVSLPQAPPQPWLERREGVSRGTVERHSFRSTTLGNERRLWTYTPPGPQRPDGAREATEPYGLLVLLDGRGWFEPPIVDTIMDNMHADSRIPPLAVVGVDPLDADTRARQLSETLTGLGHAATYTEFNGGHDFACWRGHLSDGLIAVTSAETQTAAQSILVNLR